MSKKLWEEKIDQVFDLIEEAYESMTKEEVEAYFFPFINPAQEKLMDARLKSERDKKEAKK